MSKIKLKNELKRDIKSIDRICNEVYNQKEKNINTKESVEGKTSNNVLTTGKILTEEMEGAVSLSVPLTVGKEIGKTWYDAK